eukprot:1794199-Amphidinium_carterae.1
MLDIDDDLQSIIDATQAGQEQWEEENMDGQERFARDHIRTIQDQWFDKDDMQKLNYVKDDDKSKREHDMKVQNKHYENVTNSYEKVYNTAKKGSDSMQGDITWHHQDQTISETEND